MNADLRKLIASFAYGERTKQTNDILVERELKMKTERLHRDLKRAEEIGLRTWREIKQSQRSQNGVSQLSLMCTLVFRQSLGILNFFPIQN